MTRSCDCCGREYEAKRSTSRYCSDVCRMRIKRGPNSPRLTVVESTEPRTPGSLLGSVMVELEAAGVLDTGAGRLAVKLATRIDDPNSNDSGSAVAALSRELRAVMAEAVTGRSTGSANPLDRLREGLRVV